MKNPFPRMTDEVFAMLAKRKGNPLCICEIIKSEKGQGTA